MFNSPDKKTSYQWISEARDWMQCLYDMAPIIATLTSNQDDDNLYETLLTSFYEFYKKAQTLFAALTLEETKAACLYSLYELVTQWSENTIKGKLIYGKKSLLLISLFEKMLEKLKCLQLIEHSGINLEKIDAEIKKEMHWHRNTVKSAIEDIRKEVTAYYRNHIDPSFIAQNYIKYLAWASWNTLQSEKSNNVTDEKLIEIFTKNLKRSCPEDFAYNWSLIKTWQKITIDTYRKKQRELDTIINQLIGAETDNSFTGSDVAFSEDSLSEESVSQPNSIASNQKYNEETKHEDSIKSSQHQAPVKTIEKAIVPEKKNVLTRYFLSFFSTSWIYPKSSSSSKVYPPSCKVSPCHD